MKKLFTLLAVFIAALSANADTVEKDLELVGSNITLPAISYTGNAEFQNFKKYGEVTLYDKNQTDDGKGSYKISTSEWKTLHLEFESMPKDIQVKFNISNDDKDAKYRGLDNTISPLSFDFDLSKLGYNEGAALTHIGIMSNAVQTDPVVITKACLVDANGAELALYYNGGWGVKIVSTSKLLSGKVVFLKQYAQLGGEAWCPKDELADATNATWTITLNEALPSDQYQIIVTNQNGKDYYYNNLSLKGATTITYDVAAQLKSRPGYAPATPADVKKVRLQTKQGATEETVDVKSVKLTITKEATSQTVYITDAKYATIVAERALDFTGSGLKAFAVNYDGNSFTYTEITKVPKNTAVLVYGNEAKEYSVAGTESADAVTTSLQAATTGITADGTQYVLAKGEDGLGWYPVTSGETIPAGKGYLVISNPKQAKSFYALNGDVTAIKSISKSVDNENVPVYNLAGQRVGKDYKGVVIVNGKKVIRK